MTMAEKLNREQKRRHIELIRDTEYLWKHSHPDFKNKRKKDRAYETIRDVMELSPETSVKGIWEMLRGQYVRALKNALKPSGSAAGVEPTWPHFRQMNDFLRTTTAPGSVASNMPPTSQTDQNGHVAGASTEQRTPTRTRTPSVESQINSVDTTSVADDLDSVTGSETAGEADNFRTPSLPNEVPRGSQVTDPPPPPPGARKKRRNASAHSDLSHQIEKTLEQLNSVQDEDESFGLSIAASLRKLPLHLKAECKMAINAAMYHAEVQLARERPFSFGPQPLPPGPQSFLSGAQTMPPGPQSFLSGPAPTASGSGSQPYFFGPLPTASGSGPQHFPSGPPPAAPGPQPLTSGLPPTASRPPPVSSESQPQPGLFSPTVSTFVPHASGSISLRASSAPQIAVPGAQVISPHLSSETAATHHVVSVGGSIETPSRGRQYDTSIERTPNGQLMYNLHRMSPT